MAVAAALDFRGIPRARWHKAHALYIQPDLNIARSAYGTGYPQVNNVYCVSRVPGAGCSAEAAAAGAMLQVADMRGVHARCAETAGGGCEQWMVQNATHWSTEF